MWNIMLKRHSILPTRISFFISSAGKIEGHAGVQNQTFRVAVLLQMTAM